MEDVKFVLKSLGITILVVFLLQIRVGSNTIEASTHEWLQNSAITELMRGVADGGIKVSIDFYNWVRAKTGVGESKKSSFWPFGSSDSSSSRKHGVRETNTRVSRDASESEAQEESHRETHATGSFHWGGGSRSQALPEHAGNDSEDDARD